MIKIIAAILFITLPVSAQSPTVVFGASEDAPGHPDQYLLIQPKDSPNPLGDPIVDPAQQEFSNPDDAVMPENKPLTNDSAINEQPTTIFNPQEQSGKEHNNVIKQTAPQNPKPFSESPEQQENQIQNSLYEGGNRIYDVQSYPLKDIKTITEPNVQPTITTYPEY